LEWNLVVRLSPVLASACRWVRARWLSRLGEAIGTASPIGDLRFVDLVTHVVSRREARSRADRAIDVDHTAAAATDQMMMIVADPILEACGRTRRLNAPDQTFDDKEAESVVHRLERYRTDLGPDGLGHGVGRDVRLARYSPKNCQALGGNLNTTLPKEVCPNCVHAGTL
jgi:hypothetical protein